MSPPTNIAGWSMQFQMSHRFGSPNPLLTKSMASGFYGVSGMNIVNSGQGQFAVSLTAAEVSGWDNGNYAYKISRTDSGSATSVSEGFRLLTP